MLTQKMHLKTFFAYLFRGILVAGGVVIEGYSEFLSGAGFERAFANEDSFADEPEISRLLLVVRCPVAGR